MAANRKPGQDRLERTTIARNGFVFLYAETSMDRAEFDRMFATYNALYEKVRRKYGCEKAFPHVYEKISNIGRTNFAF